MERLQEAMKRAREKREAAEPAPVPGMAPQAYVEGTEAVAPAAGYDQPRTPMPPTSVDEAWARVEEFTPTPRILRKNRLVAYFPGPEASPFDLLRTKVVQQARAKNVRRIVVTSPTPGCGKKTTSINLAFSLARNADLRTFLVDIDFRRPTLGKTLGITETHQFSMALAREAPVEDHLVRIGKNLMVATNTLPAPNPSELLHSQAASDTMAEIEERYQPDIILFDALPILASDDTIGFLEQSDAALIVAAAEQNSIKDLDVTEAEVAAATTVLGVILNKCRYTTKGYDYY